MSPTPGRPKAGEIPSGDRPICASGEGPSSLASPTPSRLKAGEVPSGDRPAYPPGEGPSCLP
jgi:hypothetical protein